jgi:hypothetical protein
MTHEEQFDEIRQILSEAVEVQRQQGALMLEHSKAIVELDKRLASLDELTKRNATSIEALIDISDGLIRNKADRKKK